MVERYHDVKHFSRIRFERPIQKTRYIKGQVHLELEEGLQLLYPERVTVLTGSTGTFSYPPLPADATVCILRHKETTFRLTRLDWQNADVKT